MKVIHGALGALLGEVKDHGNAEGVRLAAVMQSATEQAGIPRYTAWVIVTAGLGLDTWAEWRLLVGHQRAEVTEAGFHVPERLAALTGARLEEVRGWIGASGRTARARPGSRPGAPRAP